MQPLTEPQKKRYNIYRAEGMNPEKALALATKQGDNQYNPALEKGVDNILFGKGSLTEAVGSGIKEAAVGGFKTVYNDTKDYGAGFALAKSPLSVIAGVGRGAEKIVGGVLETADDLTGEVVSDFATPYVEKAVNSDVGQYLLDKATELDQKGRGIPSDILDALNLTGIVAVAKSGTAATIKQAIVGTSKEAIERGGSTVARTTGNLADMFKRAPKVTPEAQQVNTNISNIQNTINQSFSRTTNNSTTNVFDDTLITNSLDDILSEMKTQGLSGQEFQGTLLTRLDDIIKEKTNGEKSIADLDVDERNAVETSIRDIEDLLQREDAPNVVESYLEGIRGRVDSAAGAGVGIIEKLSDEFVDKSIKTVENIKAVPAAAANRIKQSTDRRIVRIAKADPEKAKESILDLYKRSIVPGVKKKNKTIPNIEKINESVVRAVPALAKKYDVQDLEDFASVISVEKKAIFKDIEKGLEAAGKEGKAVDMTEIVRQLDELAASERAEFSQPLKDAIARARKELVTEGVDGAEETIKSISPSGAQDLIADLNAQLQSYYRGSTSGTAADVTVDNLVVNLLRQNVDEIVEDLGDGSFAELKSRYTDLKRMEDDVVHRAVYEAQKGGGLSDLTDVLSAGDVVAGAFSPAFMAKGVSQFFTKEVLKELNSKDELVRQMFLYGKNLDAQ